MNQHLTTVAECARAVPLDLCRNAAAFRAELVRRLKLRGWLIKRNVRLEPGSRGDETYTCGAIAIVAYPPAPLPSTTDEEGLEPQLVEVHVHSGRSTGRTEQRPPPVLIQIERRDISYRTRAKLQSWGQRPHSGELVVQLYARTPDPIPEADLVMARGATRARTPQSVIHETADLRRLSHAIGVNEARYHRRRALTDREAINARRRQLRANARNHPTSTTAH